MFYDKPECETIVSTIDEYGTKTGVFVFKKIIPESILESVREQLEKESQMTTQYEETLIDWYAEKTTNPIGGIIDIWEYISELIYPEYVIHPSRNFLKVKPGDGGMFIHSDSPGKHSCHLLSQPDVFQTCCIIDYGLVGYFGKFEGGAVFYPNFNPDGTKKTTNFDGPCLEYQPEEGDVVIHGAFADYAHGVREVTSGTRYAYSNFVLRAEDNPGTFYNYKTDEYYNQIGDKSERYELEWMKPLIQNPQFTKEKIKAMQESGLKGKELAAEFFKDMAPE
jgi:hypothetical protein